MNPNEPTNNDQLGKQSTAEEDAALQAIEALDVEGGSADQSLPRQTSGPAPIVNNPIDDIKSITPPAPPVSPAPTTSPSPVPNASSTEPVVAAAAAFQPFAAQKKPRRPLITVLIIVVIVAVLVVAGYFGWQYYQSTP